MDAKITKSRLGLLLSYDWIKILGICVGAILIWALIFTTTATRASNGQRFEIYTYLGVSMNDARLGSLEDLQAKGALSNDILDMSVYRLDQNGYEDMILSAHFSAGQGDLLFAANTEPTKDEDGAITAYTGLTEFLMSYRANAVWLGEEGYSEGGQVVYETNYFDECAQYLNGFFGGDYENGALDKSVAEERFRARIKRDKRYKKESQILAGLEKEYERLENLRTAFKTIYEWTHNDTDTDPIELTKPIEMTGTDDNGAEVSVAWQYSFDLSNLGKIAELAGNTESGASKAEGMSLVVLDTGSRNEEDLRYEPFTFLLYLAENFDS